MGRFILIRVLLSIVTLFLLSIIVFMSASVLPGDVGRNKLGPFASQKSVDALNAKLGTDRSLPERGPAPADTPTIGQPA